ncbi:uncharacterized protein CCOS01_14909 [Colletotrichum costaricense]|uniref:Uncharacterized protein n=1 Tax=Colletotrichum costaricense TaxID=1209916 RepID=A0AAI9YI98_9PEZI|nr:uncharacterized protein CCOS01_14909 [Colletotrichum costaricense]KAK1511147.1 hypothetical protein CCOS01_14909 [Colletotrichum costaricense]
MRNRDLVPVVLQTAPASFERQPEPWRGTRRPESGEGMGPEIEHLEPLEAARRNDKTVKTVARGGDPSGDKCSRAWLKRPEIESLAGRIHTESERGFEEYVEMLGECHSAGQKSWPLEETACPREE